jgi:hypothetical protein
MKKEQDDLDNLFKKGLEDPANEASYRDEDWEVMEQMLNKRKKRRAIIYWLPVLGSVAALLLIFLGWLFLKPEVVKPAKQMAAIHHSRSNENPGNLKKENTGTSGAATRKEADSSKQKTLTPANYAGKPDISRHGQKSKSFFTLSTGGGRRNTTGNGTKKITANPGNTETIAINNIAKNSRPDTSNNQAVIANNNGLNRKDLNTAIDKKDLNTAIDKKDLNTAIDKKDLNTAIDKKDLDTAVNKKDLSTADGRKGVADNLASAATPATKKIKSTSQQKLGSRPQFALGVIASSDLNGVNSSFQRSKIGGNFGAVFSVSFAKKWTISTGATYDIKPYLTTFENYHTAYQFPTQPSSVYANCRMLDIPLNVNYQVYGKQANKITIGTGLSSYFMLREDYKFNYADTYSTGPAAYSVINKNRNILSILNLDATYTHQINSKMGVTIQPYLKVPLSDVGASQVRLQTTGVAVGLNWNLNSSKKP